MDDVEDDVKDLLKFMAEVNLLIKLSIGGGALSMINLIFLLSENLK